MKLKYPFVLRRPLYAAVLAASYFLSDKDTARRVRQMLEWFVHISVYLLKNAQSSPIVPHPGIARTSHGHGFIQQCGHGSFPKRGKSGMVLLLMVLLYHVFPGLLIEFVTFYPIFRLFFRIGKCHSVQKLPFLFVQANQTGCRNARQPAFISERSVSGSDAEDGADE